MHTSADFPQAETVTHRLIHWLGQRSWSQIIGPIDEFVAHIMHSLSDDPATSITLESARHACLHALSIALYAACIAQGHRQQVGFQVLGEYVLDLYHKLGYTSEASHDGAQETLECIYANLRQVRDAGLFLGYCRVIAARHMMRKERLVEKQSQCEISLDAPLGQNGEIVLADILENGETPIEEQVHQQFIQDALWPYLARCTWLTRREYTILYWHFKLKIDHQSIQRELHMTSGAVHVALHRAIKKLRKDSFLSRWY